MKIAIIFKPYWPIQVPNLGGMSNFVYFLSKGLVGQGHDVTVFCSKNSTLPPKVKTDKNKIVEEKIDVYRAYNNFYHQVDKEAKSLKDAVNLSFGELSQRFDYKIENYLQAFSKIYSDKFDLVHVVTHDILALYPALFSPVPSVISFHGHYQMLGPDFVRWLKFLSSVKPKHNSTFVSVSKYIKREYGQFVNSSLIYNSIDITPYKLNLAKQDYIVYLGRIESKKGVDFAINFSKKYKIPLVIAGNIVDRHYFNHHLKKDIDGQLIRYIGPVNEPQKNEVLGKAKCMFMPSSYKEAFGRVVIESLACGTPVIALRNGALRELVTNNKTGFLIRRDLKQAKQAFDKIDKIDPHYCRKFVERDFNLPRMIKQYEDLYKKIKK